jgi:Ni/Fe-hydrogenase subunit HybB-like protein
LIENILRGGKKYWLLVSGLLILMAAGLAAYLQQWNTGLAVTGLGRDISWGLYIANFTFFVGVAASAVMLIIPYYLHNSKEFRRIIILGEFMAVAACLVAITFIIEWTWDSPPGYSTSSYIPLPAQLFSGTWL